MRPEPGTALSQVRRLPRPSVGSGMRELECVVASRSWSFRAPSSTVYESARPTAGGWARACCSDPVGRSGLPSLCPEDWVEGPVPGSRRPSSLTQNGILVGSISFVRSLLAPPAWLPQRRSFRSILRCAQIAVCPGSRWSSDLSSAGCPNAQSAEQTGCVRPLYDIFEGVLQSTTTKVRSWLVLPGRDVSGGLCRNDEPSLWRSWRTPLPGLPIWSTILEKGSGGLISWKERLNTFSISSTWLIRS